MENKTIKYQQELIETIEELLKLKNAQIVELRQENFLTKEENEKIKKELKELKDIQRAKEIQEIALKKIKGEHK